MQAFIFPNSPHTEDEKKALKQAVRYQIDHERTVARQVSDSGILDGTKAFTIGSFHMEFEDGAFSSRLTRKTICPSAYSLLLHAGLLYRGIEGRRSYGNH